MISGSGVEFTPDVRPWGPLGLSRRGIFQNMFEKTLLGEAPGSPRPVSYGYFVVIGCDFHTNPGNHPKPVFKMIAYIYFQKLRIYRGTQDPRGGGGPFINRRCGLLSPLSTYGPPPCPECPRKQPRGCHVLQTCSNRIRTKVHPN